MKSVIKSLHPEACERIASGRQKFILSKSAPKEVPFKGYIYCANYGRKYVHTYVDNKKMGHSVLWNGKVIGEFVCNKIVELRHEFCPHPELGYSLSDNCGDEWWVWDDEELEIDFSLEELNACAGRQNILYVWIISEIKIYDTPKALSEFKKHNKKCYYSDLGYAIPDCKSCIDCNLKVPPANWCYIET